LANDDILENTKLKVINNKYKDFENCLRISNLNLNITDNEIREHFKDF